MRKSILSLFITCLCLTAVPTFAQMSVETLGVITHKGIFDSEKYGVGLDFGYKFNQYVTGHVRAISYSDHDWRGSVVDEGSLLVESTLLTSANKKISLSAIGGVDRDFAGDDWGFSVGLRPKVQLTKNVALVAESRIRAWFKDSKDIVTTAGLNYSF